MARVLVTRAEPGAGETAARLTVLGHEAILAPMLTIEPVPSDADVSGFQALLFTSANGVAAFAHANPERVRTIYCVGDATADVARTEGFSDVRVAGGDVGALGAFVAESARADAGRLLHIAGADLAGDLKSDLESKGFTVERRVFYRAVAADSLPQKATDALAADPPSINIILFHSARGATAFVQCVKQNTIPIRSTGRITALCLSPAVARSASTLTWRDILVAHEPREAALLALLPLLPMEN